MAVGGPTTSHKETEYVSLLDLLHPLFVKYTKIQTDILQTQHLFITKAFRKLFGQNIGSRALFSDSAISPQHFTTVRSFPYMPVTIRWVTAKSIGRSTWRRVVHWKAIITGRDGPTWILWKGDKPSDIHRRLSDICGEKAAVRTTVCN